MCNSTKTLVGFVGSSLETLATLGLMYIVIVFALCGCGGADPTGENGTCDSSQRAGTYLLTYEELQANGPCGAIPPVLVTLTGAAATSTDGCTVNGQEYSEDQCRVGSNLTCVVGGATIDFVGFVDQDDADAGHLSGVVTLTVNDPYYGACTETYNVTYVRQ